MKSKAQEDATEFDAPQPLNKFHWRRIQLMVIDKQLNERWGCMFYRFVEKWQDDCRQKNKEFDGYYREAGDAYFDVVTKFRSLQESDPDEVPEIARELVIRRIEKSKRDYIEVLDALGKGYWPLKARRAMDELMFEDIWPESEVAHKMVRDSITLLRNFYFGTKRERIDN